MRGIDQRWGVARTLLGLGALARLRRDPAGAIDCYPAALPILREIDSRPDIARCQAGIGPIALDQGQTTLARLHLAESLRLSQLTGARIGVARGLEAFAALCFKEGQGFEEGQGFQEGAAAGQACLPVLLAGAAAALRGTAGLPPAAAQQTQRSLDAASGLGQEALTELSKPRPGPVPRRRGDPGPGFRPAGHRGQPRERRRGWGQVRRGPAENRAIVAGPRPRWARPRWPRPRSPRPRSPRRLR